MWVLAVLLLPHVRVIVGRPAHPSEPSARFRGLVFNARCVNSHLLSAATDVRWHVLTEAELREQQLMLHEGSVWRRTHSAVIYMWKIYVMTRPRFHLLSCQPHWLCSTLIAKLAVVWFIPPLPPWCGAASRAMRQSHFADLSRVLSMRQTEEHD